MNEKEILNQPLYGALCDIFQGNVEVVHQGLHGEVSYTKNKLKYYAKVTGGQEFKMNCPYCGDKRGRLYINYLVCADIKQRGEAVRTYHLMKCHNEGCNLVELYKEIKGRIKKGVSLNVQPKMASRAKHDTELPRPNYLINSPKAHAAPVAYMKSRGFDLDELAKVFGVRTCDRVPGVERLGQMVLFPAMDGQRVTFWQARMSYNPPKESGAPKYYFPPGSQKSEIIYNRFNALGEQVVVITEGVLDAIRVGKSGVAVFGKSPSVSQTRIMSRIFKRKLGVLMLDPDAEKEAVEWYNRYKGDAIFGKGLFLCRLQGERDPADHSREELWEKIIESIKKGG